MSKRMVLVRCSERTTPTALHSVTGLVRRGNQYFCALHRHLRLDAILVRDDLARAYAIHCSDLVPEGPLRVPCKGSP